MKSSREYRWKYKGVVGATDDLYELLLQQQRGCCAICGVEPVGRRLDLDHNHTNGAPRGLLCGPCNRGLGWVETTVLPNNLFQRVVDYLHANADGAVEVGVAKERRPRRLVKELEVVRRFFTLQIEGGSFQDNMTAVCAEFAVSERTVYRYMRVVPTQIQHRMIEEIYRQKGLDPYPPVNEVTDRK